MRTLHLLTCLTGLLTIGRRPLTGLLCCVVEAVQVSRLQHQYYAFVKTLRVGGTFSRLGFVYTVVHIIKAQYIIALSSNGNVHVLPVVSHHELSADLRGEWNTELCWLHPICLLPNGRSENITNIAFHAFGSLKQCSTQLSHGNVAWECNILTIVQRMCTLEMIRFRRAARIFQSAWRTCVSNPTYIVCRSRLMFEYQNLQG